MAFAFVPPTGVEDQSAFPDQDPNIRFNLQTLFKQMMTYVDAQAPPVNSASDTGAANAYVVTLTPALTYYSQGQVIMFLAKNANTGVSTINVNGMGTKTIKTNANVDLAAGAILANQFVFLIYDGTNFQLVFNPFSNSSYFASAGWYKFGQFGLIIEWGSLTVAGGGGSRVTFPLAFPAWYMQAIPVGIDDQSIVMNTPDKTGFNLGGAGQATWFALGY